MTQLFWDDKAFVMRAKAIAKQRGLNTKAALKLAGLDRGYLMHSGKGRNTNSIMALARVLGVPCAELFRFEFKGPNAWEMVIGL
jgi:hypothetical protein